MTSRSPTGQPRTLPGSGRHRRAALLSLMLLGPALVGPFAATRASAQADERSLAGCDPRQDFEYLWSAFDASYGIFTAKNIDWSALRRVYAPRIDPVGSCAELFEVLSELLGHLNDHHVFLFDGERIRRSGEVAPADTATFSLAAVRRRLGQERRLQDGRLTFGWLMDSTAYLHVASFGAPIPSAAAFDSALVALAHAGSLIIDLRNNGGGSDHTVQLMASRFADRRRLYLITRMRNGPRHDDYSAPRYWHVTPRAGPRFLRPVIVLVNAHSMSAAENFVLAMRTLPQVTIVGSRTAGVFADIFTDTLSGGWQFAIPYTLHTDHLGRSWEGVGLVPDLYVSADPREIAAGTDRPLALALGLLEAGVRGTPDSSSAALARDVVPELLGEAARRGGVVALRARDVELARSGAAHAGTEGDYVAIAQELTAGGDTAAALELLRLAVARFGAPWRARVARADLLIAVGDSSDAAATLDAALREVPRRNAMERRWADRIRERRDSIR